MYNYRLVQNLRSGSYGVIIGSTENNKTKVIRMIKEKKVRMFKEELDGYVYYRGKTISWKDEHIFLVPDAAPIDQEYRQLAKSICKAEMRKKFEVEEL